MGCASRKNSFGGVCRAALATALLATTGIAAGSVIVASQANAQSGAQTSFNVPSGSLSRALAIFGSQSGTQISYEASIARGKTSPGIRGLASREEALSQILQGSGLVYSFTGSGSVLITGQGSASHAPLEADGSLVLDAITVRGGSGNPADKPYETPGSTAYISAEQIDRLRGSSPGDIFKETPGVVAAGNNNGARLDVNVRGMQGQSRVKVAIDGTQQSSTTWRGYMGVDERVYIDPELIGGVSIAKGPSAGAEGAGATGGVVSIRTLNADDILDDGAAFGVRLRGGTSDNAIAPPPGLTYDQRTDRPSFFDFENGFGSAALAVRQENFDFVAAASRRRTGNYFAGTKGPTHYTFEPWNQTYPLSFTRPGEEVFNSSEDTKSALAKATFRWGESHSLELGYLYFGSEFGESMGTLLFQQDDGFRQVQLSDIATHTYTARYHWDPGDDLFDVRLNLWGADVSGTTRAVAAAPNFSDWGFIPADEPRYSQTWTYGADLTNTSRFDTGLGGLRFDYGASYLLEDMDGEEYCSRIYTRDQCVWMQPSVGTRAVGSVFSQARWEVNDWLTVDAGLRYDTYQLKDRSERAVPGRDERDGGRLNPSLAITLSPFDGVQLFGRYAEGVRPPTLRETMVSDANAIPNPDLDPEVTKSWEFGVNYMRDGLFSDTDKARFKLAYFHNDHFNYISRVNAPPAPGQPVFTFANLDRASFSGVELSASYDTGIFFADAALTYYTDAKFCDASGCGDSTVTTDYAVAHIPADISVSLTAGLRLFEERLTVGGRVIHNGKRLMPITTQDRQRTPFWLPYTTVDAFANFKVNDNFTIDVQAQNLFDRYYVDAMDGWMPAPGRTIRASLTAKF